MKICIIDRYLLRQFVQTFLICFVSLLGLYIVIDLFTNLDHFVRGGQKVGGIVSFIAHYYAYRWIWVFDMFSGTFALISAIFTVSWIQRHNEMTALMAAGVSRIRIVAPIIAAVVVVSILAAANRELLLPRYRHELSLRPQNPLGDKPESFKPRYDERTNILLGGKHAYPYGKRIEQPSFLLMRAPPSLREHGDQLLAANATYQPPQGDRPGGYLLEGVREPRHIDTSKSLYLDGEAVLITPQDAPEWLKPDQCFLRSDVDFDQLTSEEAFKQFSSTGQLIAALRNPSLDYGSDVKVVIHSRMVKPLMDVTLLFLGLPLVVTRESRNVFLAMGLCMGLTVIFTLAEMGLHKMGESSYLLTPALAAWMPLMIFVPLSVGLAELLWK
jgi:lipopolysaccharide export system permease protein